MAKKSTEIRTTASHRLLGGSKRNIVAGARRISDADPREEVRVILVVRRRPGHPSLPDEAYWSRTPPTKRIYLSRKDFAAQYGADPDDLERLEAFAKANKLRILESSVARRSVVLSGNVEQMNAMFRVNLGRYETANGTYRGLEGSVYVPKEIASMIKGVLGLDSRPVAGRRPISPTPADLPPVASIFTPPQVARFYQFPAQNNGAGQTIGIIEFGGGYLISHRDGRATDVAAFFDNIGSEYPYQYGARKQDRRSKVS